MMHGKHKMPDGKMMSDKDMPNYKEMKRHVMKVRAGKGKK